MAQVKEEVGIFEPGWFLLRYRLDLLDGLDEREL
jgi:hypothetical protein